MPLPRAQMPSSPSSSSPSRLLLSSALSVALLAGCARAPLKGPEDAMRRLDEPPALMDDLPVDTLVAGLKAEVEQLETNPNHPGLRFGRERYSRDEYLVGLKRLLELARELGGDRAAFLAQVRKEFDFYEVYGRESWGEVLLTSYYAPRIEGSLRRKGRFTQPLYRTPDDLLQIDLRQFDPSYPSKRGYRARLADGKVVPYYSRNEIDAQGALTGRGLEICWVDPIDSFILQIQGSGTVDLGDGKTLNVNYAEKNGHPYEAIGKFLAPFLPEGQVNMYTIETWLRGLAPGDLQRWLDKNPSYVFFQVLDRSSLTYLGLPAVDGRTIATDPKLFPKGAVAFLEFPKPVFPSPDAPLPSGEEKAGRIVLDQDIGGAITGPGRVDLFWGRGNEAKRASGVVKAKGRLYYLAPKRAPQPG